MLQSAISWLIETIFHLGYPGILLLMAVESSVFPLPSELVMPPAGYLAVHGRMNPWVAILAGGAGSVLGALVNYAMAAWLGRPLLHRYGKYFLIREKSLIRTETFFARHGEISTFVGRFIPVIRHLISLPAGIARMRLGPFCLYTFVGSTLWCAILTWIGWYLGHRLGPVEQLDPVLVKRYSVRAVLILLPLLGAAVAGYIWARRPRKPA